MQNISPKKTWSEQLIASIKLFHAETGMKHSVICRNAVKNSRVWEKLMAGGTITLEIADQFKHWLEGQGIYLTPEGEPYVKVPDEII